MLRLWVPLDKRVFGTGSVWLEGARNPNETLMGTLGTIPCVQGLHEYVRSCSISNGDFLISCICWRIRAEEEISFSCQGQALTFLLLRCGKRSACLYLTAAGIGMRGKE